MSAFNGWLWRCGELDAGEIASRQAVRASCPFLWRVAYGGVWSGSVGTGCEVGGWGERHGALSENERCG